MILRRLAFSSVPKITRRYIYIIPLVILTILFGIYPMPILEVMDASVNKLQADFQTALDISQQAVQIARGQ